MDGISFQIGPGSKAELVQRVWVTVTKVGDVDAKTGDRLVSFEVCATIPPRVGVVCVDRYSQVAPGGKIQVTERRLPRVGEPADEPYYTLR